jgi:hypothetical protein
MADSIEILSPLAFGCLATTGAVTVSGRDKVEGNKLKPPYVFEEQKDAAKLTNRFKVVVTVGAAGPQETWVAGNPAGDNWAVTFNNLAAATDVTVTAKLIDTLPNPDVVLATDAMAHVNVSALCPVKDPVIDEIQAAPAEAKGGGGSPPPAPKGFLHRTVRCAYPVVPGSVEQIHRVVAVVTRVYTDPKKPKEVFREVWAAADAILQAGVATAILPLPTPAADTKYESHFMLMLNTTNAVFTSTRPREWPPV